MRAYDQDYLFDAMRTLGEAFDCAQERADYDLQAFFDLFVSTGVADAFGSGSPRYVAGMSGAELLLDVFYRAGLDVAVSLMDEPAYGEGCAYWCGWTLAYYQWATGRPFRNIALILDVDELVALYPALHEASEERAAETLEARAASLPAALATVRKARGFSQVQLAQSSGVSLRAIQQYEQRRKDISKAQAGTVYQLAQTLGCRTEDILEYPIDRC